MKKKIFKVLGVIALFVASLSIGLTSAWFTASRTATGVIKVGNGIEFTYTNLRETTVSTETVYYLLFNDQTTSNATGYVDGQLPGNTITVKNVTVALTAESQAAYMRIKVNYYYSDNSGSTWTASNDASTLGLSALLTLTNVFALDNSSTNEGYYYYTGNTTAKASFAYTDMATMTTTAVKLFGTEDTASLTLTGSVPANRQIKIELIVEGVQANQAGFDGMSW